MTKTNADDAKDTTEQPDTLKQSGGKTILGHKMTIERLNDWQQQNDTKDIDKKTLSPPSEPLSTDTAATLVDTDRVTNTGRTLKDFILNYTATPLKNYSIVVINGTDTTVDNYKQAANEKEPQTQEPTSDQHIHEINIGEKTETVLDSAEWIVQMAHQRSQNLFEKWKNSSGFDYNGTLHIVKDRAVKIVDVARGKYDKTDPIKKSTTQKDSDCNNGSSSNDDDHNSDDKSNNDN